MPFQDTFSVIGNNGLFSVYDSVNTDLIATGLALASKCGIAVHFGICAVYGQEVVPTPIRSLPTPVWQYIYVK